MLYSHFLLHCFLLKRVRYFATGVSAWESILKLLDPYEVHTGRNYIVISLTILLLLQDYVRNNDITDGSFDPEKRCREAQAATAFIWFNWALFTATTLMSFFASRSPGAGGSVVSSGIRRRGTIKVLV